MLEVVVALTDSEGASDVLAPFGFSSMGKKNRKISQNPDVINVPPH